MKTLLIPVDFTETSDNAIDYAAEWSKQFNYNRIILLKTFYDTMFDAIVVSSEYGNVGQEFRLKEREEADVRLSQIRYNLSLKNKEAEVLLLTTELPFLRAIHQVIEDEKPGIIIMGSDTNAYDNDSYVARHVIQVAKTSPVPLLIVPASRSYQPIKEVLIPVDAFAAASVNRIDALRSSPYWSNIHFKVLNIISAQSQIEKQAQAEEQLNEYLKNVNHQVFQSQEKDVITAVIDFLKTNTAQLIVALPGKYSFLYRLTHKTISDAICRNTVMPVLILK